jgi:hypothetical protein
MESAMRALYTNGQPSATTTATPRIVTGQYVAKAHLNRRQRARLAADLSTGVAVISPLTGKQAAAMTGVSVLAVTEARKRNGHNGGNGNSAATLLAALREATDAERGEVVRTIGKLLLHMTPTDRVDVARAVGVDWIWDHLISPVVSEERAAVAS